MATTTHTPISMPTDCDYDMSLTNGDWTTSGVGAGNGVTWTHDQDAFVFFGNDTGGAATFTVLSYETTSQTNKGVTLTDDTVTVANGGIHRYKVDTAFQASSSVITVECDVAGKILVLKK